MTTGYLVREVVPFIQCIIALQIIIDTVRGKSTKPIKIRRIEQNSPINIDLQGGADALALIRETLTPWRTEHAKIMMKLSELEQRASIEIKRAQVLEAKSNAAKTNAEAKKSAAEALEAYARAEKLQLENQKYKIGLQRDKVDLALSILNRLAPALKEAEKIAFVLKLLPQIEVVAGSNFNVTDNIIEDDYPA